MSINSNRSSYIEDCKSQFNQLRANNKILMHYVKDEKGSRIGVLVALKDSEGVIQTGWSLAHKNKEVFNKYIGIRKALTRATGGGTYGNVHTLIIGVADEFEDRAIKYFKTENINRIG